MNSPVAARLKLASILMLGSLASGCVMGPVLMLEPCLGAKVPHKPRPIPGAHRIEVRVPGHEPVSRVFSCEEYYDAQCSERGNYWAIREVGTSSEYGTPPLEFSTAEAGVVQLDSPKCAEIVHGQVQVARLQLRTQGGIYVYSGSAGHRHTYSGVGRHEGQVLTLDFDLILDGTLLEWPARGGSQ